MSVACIVNSVVLMYKKSAGSVMVSMGELGGGWNLDPCPQYGAGVKFFGGHGRSP